MTTPRRWTAILGLLALTALHFLVEPPQRDLSSEEGYYYYYEEEEYHALRSSRPNETVDLSAATSHNETLVVIDWNGRRALNHAISKWWKGNYLCEQLNGTTTAPVLLNVTFGCDDLFRNGKVGTGNFVSLFYALKATARARGNMQVHLQCTDALATKDSLILPWLMGQYDYDDSQHHIPRACGNYDESPIAYMMDEIRYDLRRMAIALVGIPSPDHPSAKYARDVLWKQQEPSQVPNPQPGDAPLIPNVFLDDAVLHFRCGDLMESTHGGFSLMKFDDYSRHFSPAVRSIGVVTQPFANAQQQRSNDVGQEDKCRIVVTALVEHLHERFPHARVTVHNGPNETIALGYARLIMAKQAVAGVSSFGVFGPIANFGRGFVRRPDYNRVPNLWLLDLERDEELALQSRDITLFDAPDRLPVAKINKMWRSDPSGESILAILRGDDLEVTK